MRRHETSGMIINSGTICFLLTIVCSLTKQLTTVATFEKNTDQIHVLLAMMYILYRTNL